MAPDLWKLPFQVSENKALGLEMSPRPAAVPASLASWDEQFKDQMALEKTLWSIYVSGVVIGYGICSQYTLLIDKLDMVYAVHVAFLDVHGM